MPTAPLAVLPGPTVRHRLALARQPAAPPGSDCQAAGSYEALTKKLPHTTSYSADYVRLNGGGNSPRCLSTKSGKTFGKPDSLNVTNVGA
jgi:hypothetical protein